MKIEFAVDKPNGETPRKSKYLHKKKPKQEISLLLEPKKRDWWEDEVIVVAFNVPRITARLEGLMGSNIVRLTDRLYMQQLRQNHEADYNTKLQERIVRRKAGEKERQNYLVFRGHYTPENCPNFLKIAHSIALNHEMERVRNIVIAGNLAKVPDELASHPVFIVNQRSNEVIASRRSKMKTDREKNAERLIRQGQRWERQRLIFENLEKENEEKLKARQNEQSDLEEQFRKEDDTRGIDLLRIHDKQWKPCELDLKKFLESENAWMKQRASRKSVQYSRDPLDVQNIMRARKKFREAKEKICRYLEEQMNQPIVTSPSKEPETTQPAASGECGDTQEGAEGDVELEDRTQILSEFGLLPDEDLSDLKIDYQEDTAIRDKEIFRKEMKRDVKKGYIMSKEVFDRLHYEDPLIEQLKNTENVHDLYRLAKDIICTDSNQIIEKFQSEDAALA